jgi:hypothetical protein
MNPAEKLTALYALHDGLAKAIEDAKKAAASYRQETSAGNFKTEWGTVKFTDHPTKVRLVDWKLLEQARQQWPDEVIEEHTVTVTVQAAVSESLKARLLEELMVVGSSVVDADGVIVDYAEVVPESDPTVSVDMGRDNKRRATQLVRGRLEQLTSAVRPELEEGP